MDEFNKIYHGLINEANQELNKQLKEGITIFVNPKDYKKFN